MGKKRSNRSTSSTTTKGSSSSNNSNNGGGTTTTTNNNNVSLPPQSLLSQQQQQQINNNNNTISQLVNQLPPAMVRELLLSATTTQQQNNNNNSQSTSSTTFGQLSPELQQSLAMALSSQYAASQQQQTSTTSYAAAPQQQQQSIGSTTSTSSTNSNYSPAQVEAALNAAQQHQQQTQKVQGYFQSISQALSSNAAASSNANSNTNTNSGGGGNNKVQFGPAPPPTSSSNTMSFSLGGSGGSGSSNNNNSVNVELLGRQLDVLSALMGNNTNNSNINVVNNNTGSGGQQQQQSSQSGGSHRGGGSSMGGGMSNSNKVNFTEALTQFMNQCDEIDGNDDLLPMTNNNSPSNNNNNASQSSSSSTTTMGHMANFQQLMNMISASGGGLPNNNVGATNNNVSASNSSSTATTATMSPAQQQALMSMMVGASTFTQNSLASASGGATAAATTANSNVKNNSSSSSKAAGTTKTNSQTTTTTGGTFGGSSSDDLSTLLPIFTELVSLTNTIVSAQESGDTSTVDAATTELCSRVMQDGRAMGVLGVAMNEMGHNPTAMNVDTYMPSARAIRELQVGTGKVIMSGKGGNNKNKGTTTTTASFTVSGGSSNKKLTQSEALKKVKAFASMQQQSQQQQSTKQGGGNRMPNTSRASGKMDGPGSTNMPMFSMNMIFGSGDTNAQMIDGSSGSSSSAPPSSLLPPPPDGWPPGSAQAAAAVSAMAAAFATNDNNSGMLNNIDPNNIPFPNIGNNNNSGPGGDSTQQQQQLQQEQAFLDYYDACLRARGVNGGIAEFEAFAQEFSKGSNAGANVASVVQQAAAIMQQQQQQQQGNYNNNLIHAAMGVNPTYPTSEDDVEDVPGDFEYDDGQQQSNNNAKSTTTTMGNNNNELSEQQRQAIEEEEASKRAKKAAKKRDKKARQKERAKKESEAKAIEAARTKRIKTITSWRSRVVAACLGSGNNGDVKKMDVLIGESPYKNYVYNPLVDGSSLSSSNVIQSNKKKMDDNDDQEDPSGCNDEPPTEEDTMTQEEYLASQMGWFLPNCLQKYSSSSQQGSLSSSDVSTTVTKQQPFVNNLAREKLLRYILSLTKLDVILEQQDSTTGTTTTGGGRCNSIHVAAYNNDVNFIKWVIDHESNNNNISNIDDKMTYLEGLCQDGGWTPLHYATAGGASAVVELLLSEGVDVKARTDRNLTCFNSGIRRRGNGITARELAIVLQSGAVDDDLTSNAIIIDEVIENRIEDVSSGDKASYMKTLKTLEERLTHVEKNGYTPLPPTRKGGMLNISNLKGTNDDGALEDNKSEAAAATTTSSSATSKKKKKQKKKKEAPAKNAPVVQVLKKEPQKPPSTATGEGGEDLSDPVAVALLGMGFSEDQIKSAARALGGFERATADDMVMWILGGGEIVDNSAQEGTTTQSNAANSTEGNVTHHHGGGGHLDDSEENNSAVLSKAQKKAAARAKREAEEAARKRQEELAAAQRTAAKREEQRRIRREWNEREQARHEQEKNAKIAEQMERRRRAEMEKLMPKTMLPPGAMGVPPMTVQIPAGGGKHHHPGGGPPMTIIAGGPKMPGKAKNTGSNMGIPQAPNVRAPKILARPSGPRPPNQGNNGFVPPPAQVGRQPVFNPSTSTNTGRGPGTTSPPRSIHTKPYNPSSSSHPNQPVAILTKGGTGPRNMTNTGRHPAAPQAAHADYHHHPGHQVPHSSYTGTASQFQNPSQTAGGAVPPGFVHGGSSATTDSASSSYVETNPMGTIRATAREFVPTFAPKPASKQPSAEAAEFVPSMSAQQTSVTVPASFSPPPPTRTASNDNSANQLVEPMSSLLSSFGVDNNALPSMVGNKEPDSTVPSAASSITGLSGLPTTGEDNTTSHVGSALTFESTSNSLGVGVASGLQTSSILESIQYGGEQNTGSALGSGIGLWGGGNNVTQSSGLAGLNLSSFMGSGDTTNGNNNGNGGNNDAGGSTTWGGNTGGSIW